MTADVNSDEPRSRPAAGAHVDATVVARRTTHSDASTSRLSITSWPQWNLVYWPASMIFTQLVVDASVTRLVAFLSVRRLTPRRDGRLAAADCVTAARQRRLGQRRRRSREAQSGIWVDRGRVDGHGVVVVERRSTVIDDVWIEHEVMVLVVGWRIRQLGVAVERRRGVTHTPAVIIRRPCPDTAHLGRQLRRRSRVSVARTGRLHRPHSTGVHLDGSLLRRSRSSTAVRRAIRYRRQRTRSDHWPCEDGLLVGVVHNEAVWILTTGRQTWLGSGRRPWTSRPGYHRHRLGASRQLTAELELRCCSRVDRWRSTSLMSLLELPSVTVTCTTVTSAQLLQLLADNSICYSHCLFYFLLYVLCVCLLVVIWFTLYGLGCVCQPFNRRIMYVCNKCHGLWYCGISR